MLAYQHQGLEVDSCPECFGIWFDREELRQFLSHPDWVEKVLPDLPTPDRFLRPASQARLCPGCRQEMKESQLGEILVDVCPRCQGIWLDQGELRQAVEQYRQGKRGNLVVINQIAEGLRAQRQT